MTLNELQTLLRNRYSIVELDDVGEFTAKFTKDELKDFEGLSAAQVHEKLSALEERGKAFTLSHDKGTERRDLITAYYIMKDEGYEEPVASD